MEKYFFPLRNLLRIFILIVLISFAGISTVNAEESEGGQLDIVEKVVDHDYVDFYFLGKLHLPKFDPVHVGPLAIDFSITKTLFMMFLVSIFSVLLLTFAAKSNVRNKAPKGVGNFVEIIIVFIRDEIVLPNMGKEGLRLLPYFLSLFFFILFSNLFGLIPFMVQPTKKFKCNYCAGIINLFYYPDRRDEKERSYRVF